MFRCPGRNENNPSSDQFEVLVAEVGRHELIGG
jgi:hypothetical protein